MFDVNRSFGPISGYFPAESGDDKRMNITRFVFSACIAGLVTSSAAGAAEPPAKLHCRHDQIF
jgi:hypothetical protein